MCGDEEIIGPDHRAPPLEVGAHLRVVPGGVLVERHSIEVRQERREGRGVLRAPR